MSVKKSQKYEQQLAFSPLVTILHIYLVSLIASMLKMLGISSASAAPPLLTMVGVLT